MNLIGFLLIIYYIAFRLPIKKIKMILRKNKPNLSTTPRTLVIADIHGSAKALEQVLNRANVNEKDTIIQLGDVADGWSETSECVDILLNLKKTNNCVFIRGNHDCLDELTEIYTNKGWIKIQDLTKSHLVRSLNRNGSSEWGKISKIIRKTSDHINYYENQRISLAMTDNHRILYRGQSGYGYKTVKEYSHADRLNIPLSAYNSVDKGLLIDHNDLKLIGWVLTDGSITDNSLIIYQSKVKTLNRIENILNSSNIKYSKTSRQRYTKEIRGIKLKKTPLRSHRLILNKEYSRRIISKYNLKKDSLPELFNLLSTEQVKILFHEIILADGTKYRNSKKNNYILHGTENFLGSVQGLLCNHGFSCNLTKDNRESWILNISENIESSLRGKFIRVEKETETWCINTPLSNFMIRRKGKVCFTGNCWVHDWIKYGRSPIIWTEQGGKATLDSYVKTGRFMDKDHKDFWLKDQVDWHIDDKNRIFIHAGWDYISGEFPLSAKYPVKAGSIAKECHWDRSLFHGAKSAELSKQISKDVVFRGTKEFNEVYIGHTATKSQLPENYMNLYNIDSGCGWHGKLTIIDIETKEYWQSDYSKELYPNEKGR